MIPRFSNPHSLLQFSKTVPRAELYHDGDKDGEISFSHNEAAIAELNQLLAESIPVVQYESNTDDVSPRKSKKRKREEIKSGESNLVEDNEEELHLFRLVSSALPPLPVSLLPPPPPPSITREPDMEDSEHQAMVRRERAQATSVDAETIIREAQTIGKLLPFRSKTETTNISTKLGDLRPSVMVIRTIQSPRKTRPPVHYSQLTHFPYASDMSTVSFEPVKSRSMDCRTIDAEGADLKALTTHRRSRRRRKTSPQDKQRPIPQFWRPSPSLTGKCRGYAYGYPGYLASATGSLRVKYTRDHMKKGVHVDNI